MGAASTLMQGYASMRSSQFNWQVAQDNAQLADNAAKDAIARGSQAAYREQLQNADVVGKQQAAYSASGVVAGAGSALDKLTDTKYLGAIDAQTIQDNAGREAWGLETKSRQYLQQASQIQDASRYNAAGTDITAMGQIMALGAGMSSPASSAGGQSSSFFDSFS
jgi:hypothetical protein